MSKSYNSAIHRMAENFSVVVETDRLLFACKDFVETLSTGADQFGGLDFKGWYFGNAARDAISMWLAAASAHTGETISVPIGVVWILGWHGDESVPAASPELVPGEPCPTCGKPVAMSAAERKRRERERKKEEGRNEVGPQGAGSVRLGAMAICMVACRNRRDEVLA